MTDAPAAIALEPLFRALLGPHSGVAVRLWDGSELTSGDESAIVIVRTPEAVRRIIYAPNDLGLGRAYVSGEIDLEGDALATLHQLARHAPDDLRLGVRTWMRTLSAARRLGVLGRPVPPPPEEARLRGRRHTRARDATAISHHYDVSNEFYRLVLGESMTYSCVRFVEPGDSLEAAQEAKHDLISRKLGLAPGMRLLDVGCGWGGMVIHAALHHGVEAVGVTLSRPQCDLARKRVADAGIAHRVEIRFQDYRDLAGESFDAISSIGMFEHVGATRMRQYFDVLYRLLPARGRLLNHAISTPDGARLGRRSFMGRYVFPTASSRTSARSPRRWRRAGSRFATSSRCGSTTRSRSGGGSPTWSAIGTRPWSSSARPGFGCGGCTWPAPSSASSRGPSACTKSSGRDLATTAPAACR